MKKLLLIFVLIVQSPVIAMRAPRTLPCVPTRSPLMQRVSHRMPVQIGHVIPRRAFLSEAAFIFSISSTVALWHIEDRLRDSRAMIGELDDRLKRSKSREELLAKQLRAAELRIQKLEENNLRSKVKQ